MPIGMICVEEEDGAVVGLYMEETSNEGDHETALLQQVHMQLVEYFDQKRCSFDIPIRLDGTEFQKKVWKALQSIPYGKTYSYKELATTIGNPKASRAVGGANHKNPILILIPCHRVIGAGGNLVGFAAGLDVKEYLLKLEQ
jgi:methylated-DNA-[protein]-cysteine S-methyltransferase